MDSETSAASLWNSVSTRWTSLVSSNQNTNRRRWTLWPDLPPRRYQFLPANTTEDKEPICDFESNSSLATADQEELLSEHAHAHLKATKRSLISSFLWRATLILLAVFAVGCVVGSLALYSGKAPKHITQHCGNSTGEALALGCKLDVLSGAWLPEKCRDDELAAEFDRAAPDGHWKYYRDQNLTEEITKEDVMQMGYTDNAAPYYFSGLWHATHCHYYWRKLYRAPGLGKIVEPRYDTMGHITHCWDIMTIPEVRGSWTRLLAVFETC